MNNELIAILEQIEREKGISKEVLLESIEQAMEVAARKVAKITDEEAEISVQIDRETGEVKAFVGDEEITSKSLARIAAQTARQVIVQRMREAEKDVIYDEYKDKIGTLISGTVYRFEKNRVVLDLFGKTEAVIMRRELSPLDDFKLGDRVRAYCLEVRKDKGAQIVASRRAASFVRKLFELEVPEIYDGIVEIKSIARDAGDRTKIAVYSKDDKIDCVGACVGMRGSRVKNIVQELRGEKIDIVRYHEKSEEFIKAALLPAEVGSIALDKEHKRAIVLVGQDQLSLAIGKSGQNVRLASRLTGWEIDVRTREELEREHAELGRLKGVGKQTIESLIGAGFQSLKTISSADADDLATIKGIGDKKAEDIINQAKEMTGSKDESA
jgi:N utilization substance protein A